MILLDNLYSILSRPDADQQMSATFVVKLLPESVIFAAHFPGEPIMPGACIVQMVQEVASLWRSCDLEIVKVNNLKFLAVISPAEVQQLEIQLELKKEEEDHLQIKGALVNGGTEFTKLSLTLRKNG